MNQQMSPVLVCCRCKIKRIHETITVHNHCYQPSFLIFIAAVTVASHKSSYLHVLKLEGSRQRPTFIRKHTSVNGHPQEAWVHTHMIGSLFLVQVMTAGGRDSTSQMKVALWSSRMSMVSSKVMIRGADVGGAQRKAKHFRFSTKQEIYVHG